MGVLMRGGLLLSPVAVVVAVSRRGGQSSSLRFSPSSPLLAEEDPTHPDPPDEPADEEGLPAHEAGISLAHEDEISTPRQSTSCGSVTLLADHGDAPQQTPSSSRATATHSPVPATNTNTITSTHRTEAEAALTLPDIFRRVTQLAHGGDYEQAVFRALHFQQLHQRMHYAEVELLETSTEDQHRDHMMLHALRAFLAAAVRSSHSHRLSRSSSSSLGYLPMPHALLSRAFLQTGRQMRFVQKHSSYHSYHCPQWGPKFKSVKGNEQPIKGSFLAPRPQRSILRKEYYVGNYQHWKFQGLPVLGVYSGGSAGEESFPRVFAGRSNVDVMSGPRYDEDEGAGAAEGGDSSRESFGASWENYALAFDANRRHSEKKHRYRFSSAPVDRLSELDEKLQVAGHRTARDDTWLVFESPAVFTVVQCEYDGTDAARRVTNGGIRGLDTIRILAGCEATVCRVDETGQAA
eukprot:g15150.t1